MFTRRRFLGATAGVAAGLSGLRVGRAQSDPDRKFLIVVGATGGASIIDAALALRESECSAASTIACYPDSAVQNVPDSPFRAVRWSGDSVGPIPAPFRADQLPFFTKHAPQSLVATVEGTSVNHAVGQRRSITGNEAWSGRTLQEAVATAYGEGLLLPNVHLATGTAFTEPGNDPRVPDWAKGESVSDARLWPLSLHGSKGISTVSPADVDAVRAFRKDVYEPSSRFDGRFRDDPRLARWKELRDRRGPALEAAGLVDRLLFLQDSPQIPLSSYGFEPGADAAQVRAAFPAYMSDPLEAQGALAFLLLKNRVSASVTVGPSFNAQIERSQGGFEEGDLVNPPIAFDFSHQSHRAAQAVMWDRVLNFIDRLIGLLQSEPYGDDGTSMWDRTLIYVATEFGRTRNRPEGAEEFGSGHDLRNGHLIISPLVKGNRVLGGVDPETGLTYGFDRSSGDPTVGRTVNESVIFSGILHALDVDTAGSGLPSVPAFTS